MKEVLVVARYFAPQSVMGAVRPTKIAKYLTLRHNCRVTVITAKDGEAVCDPILQKERELFDVIEIKDVWWARLMVQIDRRFKRAGDKNASEWGYPPRFPDVFSRLFWNLKIIMESGKEMAFARRAAKAAKAAKKSGRNFDAIFSTYGPVGVHYAAKKIKEAFPLAHWNADFRDPAYSKNLRFRRYKRRSDRLARDVERYADSITVTTPGIMADMEWRCGKEFRVVSNGFDPDDAVGLPPQPRDGRFHIVYTGSLYDEKRDFAPLFGALSELIARRLIDAAKLCFDYAGPDFEPLRQSAVGRGLAPDLLCNHGKITRRDALRMQRQADLLVLVSWGTAGGSGDVVPGKIFEYMMSQKPVLAICPGDCGTSELRRIFDGAAMGFYFTGGDDDSRLLKEYLLFAYQNSSEFLQAEDVKDFIRGFDYRYVTDRMASIMGLAEAASE